MFLFFSTYYSYFRVLYSRTFESFHGRRNTYEHPRNLTPIPGHTDQLQRLLLFGNCVGTGIRRRKPSSFLYYGNISLHCRKISHKYQMCGAQYPHSNSRMLELSGTQEIRKSLSLSSGTPTQRRGIY